MLVVELFEYDNENIENVEVLIDYMVLLVLFVNLLMLCVGLEGIDIVVLLFFFEYLVDCNYLLVSCEDGECVIGIYVYLFGVQLKEILVKFVVFLIGVGVVVNDEKCIMLNLFELMVYQLYIVFDGDYLFFMLDDEEMQYWDYVEFSYDEGELVNVFGVVCVGMVIVG